MSKENEEEEQKDKKVHITWWKQVGDHSKIYPYIDLDVLALMEGNRENAECCSYVLGIDEVLSVMGWDKLPGLPHQGTINIGKVWEPSDELGQIVYPGEG